MLKIIKPLQISATKRVLEQDNKFYLVATAVLGFKLGKNETLLEIEYLKEAFDCMGNHVIPDMGMPKPQGEYLASGKFFAPEGRKVQAGEASITLGEKKKSLHVFGERHWGLAAPSEPTEFAELELNYATAFGGNGFEKNPTGVGYKSDFLPRIELAGQSVTSKDQDLNPASFAPLDVSLPQRTQYQGTYDDSYLAKYFPGLPPDFDWRFYMAAPADQWINQYFVGDESYEINNMHPTKRKITGVLPNLRARCFIEKKISEDTHFSELDMNLDTVWFFPEAELGLLYYRAGTYVLDDEAQDVANLLFAYEKLNDPKRSQNYYREALERRVRSEDPLLNNFNTRDLIAEGDTPAMVRLQEMALEDMEPSEFEKNFEVKAEKVRELVNENLEDTKKQFEKNLSTQDMPKDAPEIDVEELFKTQPTPEMPKDPDVIELNDKLESLLPGITSGDPKQLNLESFSFDKIPEIMDAVSELIDKKQKFAQDEINKSTEIINARFQEELENLEDVDKDKLNEIQSLFSNLDEHNEKQVAKLPRLDIKGIFESLTVIDEKNGNFDAVLSDARELGVSEDEISKIDQSMDQLNFDNETTRKRLEESEIQFKDMYRIGAHFQEPGKSPHEKSLEDLKNEFLTAVSLGESLQGRDWACLDLSDQILDGIDLSNCYLEQINFSGASLCNANFEKSILARSTFTNTNLSGCNFKEANLGAVVSKNSDFSNCNLESAKCSKSQFYDTNFTKANLTGIETLEIMFKNCNLSHAISPEIKFIEIKLEDNNFEHADLTKACFIDSKINHCNFSGATLEGGIWAESSVTYSQFNQANMSSSCFVAQDPLSINLNDLEFNEAILNKSNFQFMVLKNADFTQAVMINSNCNYADMRGCDFTGAILKQTQFRNAILDDAIFKDANLMEGFLAKADLVRTKFINANLYAVDFLRATIKDTDFSFANLDTTIIKDWRPS